MGGPLVARTGGLKAESIVFRSIFLPADASVGRRKGSPEGVYQIRMTSAA